MCHCTQIFQHGFALTTHLGVSHANCTSVAQHVQSAASQIGLANKWCGDAVNLAEQQHTAIPPAAMHSMLMTRVLTCSERTHRVQHVGWSRSRLATCASTQVTSVVTATAISNFWPLLQCCIAQALIPEELCSHLSSSIMSTRAPQDRMSTQMKQHDNKPTARSGPNTL